MAITEKARSVVKVHRTSWLREMASRETLKIVLLAMGAAMAYGVVHDQITIRVCPEYFTVAHPPFFRTSSLTLIALGWGVVATWWAGLAAGIALALAARAGSPEKFTWRRLLRPVLLLILLMGICATLAGFAGHSMAVTGRISSLQAWGHMLPLDEQAAFMADVFAHDFSYLAGGVGSMILALATAWKRYAR